MTDEEIIKRAKDAEKRTGLGELVHSPISKGINSAYGIGFIEGMVEYRNSMQEEPLSEEFEEALAREWQGYNDRGAATVDALEDNTQELAFAKGFYRGWNYPKQLPISEDLKKAIDETLVKNAKANNALQEGLRNGKKAVLIIGDDMPDYQCIFIPNGFSAKIEGNKVIFTKDKEPASNEANKMEFKRLDIPDLKKAAMNYSKIYSCVQAFMDGAKWHKEQMMKDAVYGDVLHAAVYPNQLKVINAEPLPKGYRSGDKVKIIIVKED